MKDLRLATAGSQQEDKEEWAVLSADVFRPRPVVLGKGRGCLLIELAACMPFWSLICRFGLPIAIFTRAQARFLFCVASSCGACREEAC